MKSMYADSDLHIQLPPKEYGLVVSLPNLTNSVALVRDRTIPTERQTLVGEVSTNFCL
jgi:hypothetical protein